MMLAPYGWLTLCAVIGSLLVWRRIARRDPRLLTIYLAALAGAFVGAKVVYFCAEGYLHWHDPDRWRQLATGKSILGGLLGGYLSVEIVKRFLRYRGVTGDWFALLVPCGVAVGRVGCWMSGCCRGVPWPHAWFTVQDATGQARWPAVPLELLFNLVALGALAWLKHTSRLRGQLFHLYLIAYGIFRFFHEFVREEPRLLYGLTGYQMAALAVLLLGVLRFYVRRNEIAARQPVVCINTVSLPAQGK